MKLTKRVNFHKYNIWLTFRNYPPPLRALCTLCYGYTEFSGNNEMSELHTCVQYLAQDHKAQGQVSATDMLDASLLTPSLWLVHGMYFRCWKDAFFQTSAFKAVCCVILLFRGGWAKCKEKEAFWSAGIFYSDLRLFIDFTSETGWLLGSWSLTINVKMSGLCLQLDMKMTPCPPLFFHWSSN